MVRARGPVLALVLAAVACARASAQHDAEAGVDETERNLQLLDLSNGSGGIGITLPPLPVTLAPVPVTLPVTLAPVPVTLPVTLPVTPPVTLEPTPEPTTAGPTPEPTQVPSSPPPTAEPISEPTVAPTTAPPVTTEPPVDPTTAPPVDPTTAPPVDPTTAPPVDPTTAPPVDPTTAPPVDPTTAPPVDPTTAPPVDPTTAPPLNPITLPPLDPTTAPPVEPTLLPTVIPTSAPSVEPTSAPPVVPTTAPPVGPTTAPPASSPPPPVNPTSPEPSSPVGPSPAPVTPSSGSGSGSTGSPPPPTEPPSSGSPVPATPPPVSVVPVVISIETNAPSAGSSSASKDDSAKKTEPPIDSGNNQPDVIVFNATTAANTPTVDPFEIKEVRTVTERPVVLDIDSPLDITEAPKKYVRGQVPEIVLEGKASGGTTSTVTTGASSGGTETSTADSPNVIGGRKQYMPTDAAAVLSKTSASLHDFLRYSAVAFAGISVALLLYFHFVSLDAALFWTNPLWSPNTWEFLLYVSYLQQMASVSQLTLLKTPYFLWDYSDSFSWTNFLLVRTTAASATRRLETIVLGGVVSFADRIGALESKILYNAAAGFSVVFGVLCLVFLVGAVLAKRRAEQQAGDDFSRSVRRLRSTSIRTLGLCVLIWYFALFPLSLYASFEISMEISATQAESALVVALLALVGVCFGVLAYSGRVIMHRSKEELQQFENMATWGSLYAEYTYRGRMFFVIGALVQIVTGIVVGTMDADPTQLLVIMAVHALFLAAVFVLKPFAETLAHNFTYALGALKIVNCGLAFAFLNSNSLSAVGRNRVADAFIGINTLVIVAWFVRQLVVFSTYIRVWMQRHERTAQQQQHQMQDSTAKFETRTEADSDLYASIATARAAGDGASSGSGHASASASASSAGLTFEQLQSHNSRPLARGDMEAAL